ncbi:MAG TPA: hypothetical protein VF896_10570 [Anaerolineales bacterium]
MNQQEATDFVIRELGKHRQRNDIIQKLCEEGGMNWGDAEKFMRRVEVENKSAIALKQSPLITVIGMGTIILGLALTLWVAIETIQGYIIFFLSFPVPYLGNIFYFITGLAMLLGGMWGMWDTIIRIWNS